MKEKLKIVMISDTHTKHRQVELPKGDVLFHTGDFSNDGHILEIAEFNNWLGENKHKYKYGIVVIPGNHELTMCSSKRVYNPATWSMLSNATLLHNSSVEIGGWKIYGSASTKYFYDWAFNVLPRHLDEEWGKIPSDTDILLTHGQPLDINDQVRPNGEHLGDIHLKARINDTPSIKLYCGGHLHGGYNLKKYKDVTYVNASICNEAYKPVNKPIVVTLSPEGTVLPH